MGTAAVVVSANERTLLRALQEDARRPLKAFAGLLGVDMSTVSKMINKLRHSGVIRRISAIVDLTEFGTTSLGFFELRCQFGEVTHGIVAVLKTWPEVEEVHAMAGHEHLLVKIRVRSNAELGEFQSKLVGIEGVQHVSTQVALRSFFERQAAVPA